MKRKWRCVCRVLYGTTAKKLYKNQHYTCTQVNPQISEPKTIPPLNAKILMRKNNMESYTVVYHVGWKAVIGEVPTFSVLEDTSRW